MRAETSLSITKRYLFAIYRNRSCYGNGVCMAAVVTITFKSYNVRIQSA